MLFFLIDLEGVCKSFLHAPFFYVAAQGAISPGRSTAGALRTVSALLVGGELLDRLTAGAESPEGLWGCWTV